jgi:glycosyltransferase involved in cell wall biosynthesis
MLISIVIPLYNKEKYISRAINSVLTQSYIKFELIVVDDGSTDESVNLVRQFSDTRIRLVSQKNAGVSLARNIGVKNSKADWVAFLDADDEYESDFLKETVIFLKKNKDANLSFVGANYFLGSRGIKAKSEKFQSGVYDYFQLFGNQRSPNHSSTTTVNKAIFLEVGGFPEGIKIFEDWLTWFKLACAGNFGYISHPLGMYHYVEDSVSKTFRDNVAYSNYSLLVPLTIKKYVKKYSFDSSRKKIARACVSEFCFYMAISFASKGEKVKSLKLLKHTSLIDFFKLETKRKKLLFAHVFIPESVKRFYRNL